MRLHPNPCPLLSIYKNSTEKWMKDLNVKHGAMVTLEKYIIETFLDIDMGQDSLNMNMEKSTTKEK